MSKPKFTPGPYHLGESKSGRRYIYAQGKEQPLKPEVKLNKTGVTSEMVATAHLLAAAPELYDALNMMVAQGGPLGSYGDAAFAKACAALAKAEGNQ